MRPNHILFFFALLLSTSLLNIGCGDDTTGCTDPTADNYDPEAVVDSDNCAYSGCSDEQAENYDPKVTNDDGSCIYARDKFFGSFLGSFTCMNAVLAPITNSDSLVFQIKEPVDPEDKSKVVFGLTLEGIPVDLEGTVLGNTLTLSDTLLGFPIPIGGLTVNGDIIGNGSATISGDGQMLEGILGLTVVLASVPPPFPSEIADMCDLVGVRQ